MYGTVNTVYKVILDTETPIVVPFIIFFLIIMNKKNFIDSQRLWRREGGAESAAAATAKAEICRGPVAVWRFLRW